MVIFEWVSYKNFMSTGNTPVVIKLNEHKKTLISAKNGTGKSTFLDAICYALFGSPHRDINLPLLINTINGKQCLVCVAFTIGKTKYEVRRGMKPRVFEIWKDGVLINQEPDGRDYQDVLEKQILKMNYRAFTQVVVMGSASYTPFMKLKTQDRRGFIEDLLDIRVFSVMSKLVSKDIKDTKEKIRDLDASIRSCKDMIQVIEDHIKVAEADLSVRVSELEANVDELQNHNESLSDKAAALGELCKEKQKDLSVFDDKEESLSRLKDMRKKAESKLSEYQRAISYYDSLGSCPTCKQNITDETKSVLTEGARRMSLEIENNLPKLLSKIEDAINSLSGRKDIESEMEALNSEIRNLNQMIYGNNLLIKKAKTELSDLKEKRSKSNPDKTKLKETARKAVELTEEKGRLSQSLEVMEASVALLHDSGMKAKIIQQYIPTINSLVNKNLATLDFFCSFNIDEEFNEVIKSRHRDTFTYNSFSEGEKQRIDLAMMFAWRDVAKAKNSVNTNLLIMDEVLDSSMDVDGMHLCLDLISNMKDANVFVVTHREISADNFDSCITLIKKNNFTEVVS